MSPRNHVLDWDRDPPLEGANLGGVGMEQHNVTYIGRMQPV